MTVEEARNAGYEKYNRIIPTNKNVKKIFSIVFLYYMLQNYEWYSDFM